jgi:hypothetical protein
MTEKTKLSGGPDKTVTWIWMDPEKGSQLKLEFYDFSETAQRMFGNDETIFSYKAKRSLTHAMDGSEFQKLFWH